jgi:threonine dehydrogenase-like Zn-dependent dehydrogenase
MRALHWDGNQLQLRGSHPEPQRQEQWALVRVRLAGICSTDLQILKGYMGFTGVLGHEFVGEVIDGAPTLMGKRVVGEINFACGTCTVCQQQLGRHCANRQVMGILNADGSFAEYMRVPVANLHAVPENVPDEAAVFTEPLAAAFEVLEQIHLKPGAEVVILGDGKLGLLCAQVLHLAGARVTVVGRHEKKLSLLRQCSIRATNRTAWQAQPADVVVEATGTADGLAQAMAIVRPRGTLVLKSTVAQAHTLSLAPLVVNEVTVVGSRCGPFSPALQALAQQQLSVTPLIEAIYPLSEGRAAVAHATQPGVLKVLLRP